MIFDTDVLIWFLRGNAKAKAILERTPNPCLSVVAYLELLQGARSREEVRAIRRFLHEWGATMLPLTPNIGTRAVVYLEEYGPGSSLCMGDALQAATAVENELVLCTANVKHYRVIADLSVERFRP
jgi:predicted nucleic acid-binding protein